MHRVVIVIVACFLLPSCQTLNPDYEIPTVVMSSFKAIPSEGVIPSFEIGLHIINPNPEPLKLEGVVYSIALQGHELVKGVGKGYPEIEGYSEGYITLTASANLLRGIQFITGMAQDEDKQLEYAFNAKLDVGGFFPSLKVSETGSFNPDN
jgi:LEA14-like dessication related protein